MRKFLQGIFLSFSAEKKAKRTKRGIKIYACHTKYALKRDKRHAILKAQMKKGGRSMSNDIMRQVDVDDLIFGQIGQVTSDR